MRRSAHGGSTGRRRRGMATLVVLLLIAVALAVAYASMRSQTMTLQIQRNATLRASARDAAMAGMAIALKTMQTSSWCDGDGVSTVLSKPLSDGCRFVATYATGDDALKATDPNYAEYAYRVTVHVTGYATEAGSGGREISHHMSAVVRLVPRQLASEPSDWAAMQRYTVYQTTSDPFELDLPCRIAGPVRVQGQLKITAHYPSAGSDAWRAYLEDLNSMRFHGSSDCRQFNGPVSLPSSGQDVTQLDGLVNHLHVPVQYLSVDAANSDWSNPTPMTSYRLYPGGQTYGIPTAPATLENARREADPITNPLGLFYRDSNIDIKGNVTVRGSLLSKGDIAVQGKDVLFQPVDLPNLVSSEGPLRLPVARCNNFLVRSTGDGELTGLVACFDQFLVERSPDTTQVAITGRVIARKVYIKERDPWPLVYWSSRYNDFQLDLFFRLFRSPYFPIWLREKYGRDPAPNIVVNPDPSPVSYHWNNQYNPIYVPHPDDLAGGVALRWEIVRWGD